MPAGDDVSRIVGLDPGGARIGLAISDEDRTIAFPRESISAKGSLDQTAEQIADAIADDAVAAAVVGLPLRLNGTEGESARRARVFGEAMRTRLGIEVVYWDERMTTVSAERSLREMGRRGAKQREVVDESAATILLQSYLDAKKGGAWIDPHE